MKNIHIINHLRTFIPEKTDLFNDIIEVDSITSSGLTATVTTTANHGLITDHIISISGAKVLNPVTINSIGLVATAETTSDHDLTENWQEKIVISGSDQAGYNGENPLLSVPNRRKFTYSLPSIQSSPATGTIFLHEDLKDGYNGRKKITVISPNQFMYELAKPLYSPAAGSAKIKSNIRISGAATAERAIKAYTEQTQDSLWMFCVLGDTLTSRSKFSVSDATTESLGLSDPKIKEVENLSIYVFIPAHNDISGIESRDLAEDIKVFLYSCLLSAKLPSTFSEERVNGLTPNGDGLFNYDSAIYIHEYRFQTVAELVIDDMFCVDDSVAFRDLEMVINNDFNESIINTEIDLDDNPL